MEGDRVTTSSRTPAWSLGEGHMGRGCGVICDLAQTPGGPGQGEGNRAESEGGGGQDQL